ncbi:hypothetical protein [Zavarzinella formosa]|uniref:hypothetical protein n=1 Tax=Zavarzinella formosa TaxID=360055 RepID=UPI0012F84CC8|nr:hypothetical protein [Zavarzinella formosa]
MSESAQYPVCLPYAPGEPATSGRQRLVRRILLAVWAVMVLQGLVFVWRYALTNPFVDEWDFVEALYGEEPALPWLWQLHNEHRFPLPRVLYLTLFWITGDLRTGCYVSLFGVSMLSLGLMNFSRKIRGRASLADAVFPMLLLQCGQAENLYMGYQICFMFALVLACGQLVGMLTVTPQNHFRRGLQVGLMGIASLMCGAAGLAYGSVGLAWVGWLAFTGKLSPLQRLTLGPLALTVPVYIWLYRQGYRRPGHHPPSAGIFESIRVGLEAQAVAVGPAATGIWPFIGIVMLLLGIGTFLVITRNLLTDSENRLRWWGLMAMLAGSAGVSFGIGWGRSGFEDDMGFAWRYGWITLPALFTIWFACLMDRSSQKLERLLGAFAAAVVIMTPINIVSGFRDGEKRVLPVEKEWEQWVREGKSPLEITKKFYPDDDEVRKRIIAAMRLLKKNRYTYYEMLREGDSP